MHTIDGAHAGHWTHASQTTGVTAFVFPKGARGGYAQPGHAPGSRELGTLSPTHLAESIHGFCLSGGSAFGLAAADGVMSHLAEHNIGLLVGGFCIPLVPTAILFDLPVAAVRPGAAEGALAAAAAMRGGPLTEGAVGAGAGGRVGKAFGNIAPGGFGIETRTVGDWTVSAAFAVNAFGGIRDPDTGVWLAGGPLGEATLTTESLLGQNTTIGVVVTDAPLSRAQCTLLAEMAVAGMARAVEPAFTPFDGDTIFVAATGEGAAPDSAMLCRLGWVAAGCVGRAIARAVAR
jgi:L-aminopeptidase/D-esterase-like protein